MDNEKMKEDCAGQESFEDLLNSSGFTPVYMNPGQKTEAEVIKITNEWVFIDTGGKSEGYIALNEFVDKDGSVTVKEGDKIDAYFLSSKNSERHFTSRLSMESGGKEFLEDAFHNGIPVQGVVEKKIKGGYDIRVAGNVRAFCPFSQMGTHIAEEEDLIGSELTFRIGEYGEKGRNIVLSRRMILDEEREKKKEELKGRLREGMTVQGSITSVRDFGAFVYVEGIEGLIPVSEVSWGRVDDIKSRLNTGQTVEVMIKKLDWDNNRFSFSLKNVMPDPWSEIKDKYPEGSVHEGRVARLAKFGAFVTLEDGVDGLIHVSALSGGRKVNHPREILETGRNIKVKVDSVDEDKRRISLSILSDEPADGDISGAAGDYHDSGSSSGSLGTLGDLIRAGLEKK